MTQYTIKDTNSMTWEEMSSTTDILISKVQKYFDARGEQVAVFSPLLRTGGIIGGIMAIKMKVVTMLPIQFKYFYNPTDIKQVLSLPEIMTDISGPMNIVLCEGNTSRGSIAVKAAELINGRYPQAKIYLATLTKVFGGPDRLEGIEEIFYGRLTDENFKASEEDMRRFDIRKGITIFPWENAEDELSDINAA